MRVTFRRTFVASSLANSLSRSFQHVRPSLRSHDKRSRRVIRDRHYLRRQNRPNRSEPTLALE
jgi:hypothetical protein